MATANGDRAFCKAAKYEHVEEFRDEGISETKELDARPGLAALIDRIESNASRSSSWNAPIVWRAI